jgi:hypothetical protein
MFTIKSAKTIGIIAILLFSLFVLTSIPVVMADTDHNQLNEQNVSFQTEDWSFYANGTPIIDPSTGTPYPSFAAAIQDMSPSLWRSFTQPEKDLMNESPAMMGSFGIRFYNLTAATYLRQIPLEGVTMKKADYYQRVYPDLYAVVPNWLKSLWMMQEYSWTGYNIPPGVSQPGAFIQGNPIPVTNGIDLSSMVNQLQLEQSSTLFTDPSLVVNVKTVTPASVLPPQGLSHSQLTVGSWKSATPMVPTGIDNGGPMQRTHMISEYF